MALSKGFSAPALVVMATCFTNLIAAGPSCMGVDDSQGNLVEYKKIICNHVFWIDDEGMIQSKYYYFNLFFNLLYSSS